MPVKQFHDESATSESHSRLKRFREESGLTDEAATASIIPLLVGLELNGRLAGREKEFLDSLAPAKSLAFLIRNRTYLHPEDVELFPYETIQTAIHQGGEAVFSHRYRPERRMGGKRNYTIFTSIINPSDEDLLILGFFGPEYELADMMTHERFSRLVSLFRRAHPSVKRDMRKIRGVLNREEPTLLVNRASGLILAGNFQASQLVPEPGCQLIGDEFGRLKGKLTSSPANHKISIGNISAAGLRLSVVSFADEKPAEPTDRDMSRAFSLRIQSSVSNITLAASLLEQTLESAAAREESGLTRVILEESDRIDRLLKRSRLVLDFDQIPRRDQNLLYELERAIHLADINPAARERITVCGTAENLDIIAPDDAYLFLFDSILAAHLPELASAGETTVTFGKRSGGKVTIVFETSCPQPIAEKEPDADSRAYLAKLSRRLGLQLRSSRIAADGKIITEITLSR